MDQQTNALQARVRGLVIEAAPIEADAVEASTTLAGDLGYDSLGMLELVNVLENEFDLPTVPDQELADIKTIGDIEDLVLQMAAENAATA